MTINPVDTSIKLSVTADQGVLGAISRSGPVEAAKMTLEQPAGEMWQKIREELNEKADTKEADLAHIKEWLKKEPHLPDEFDDQRIMTFLRGCKFSLEKTKRKLDMYFTMRAAVPEFFNDRDVNRPELQEILNIVQMPPLPGLTPEGRRVIVMRGIDKDIQTPNVADAFKLALMLGDVRLAEEKEGVAGDVYVLDASVATPTHFAKFTPTLVKKFLVCVQECVTTLRAKPLAELVLHEAYPVKLKEVHVINVSPLVDKIVNFVKPFIKDKIKERIFLHTDTNDLYKYVPKEMLPQEYGGNAGPMNDLHNAWVKKLDEYKDWFAAQENLKANEALRPGKPTNYDELFGIDGSFRQLDRPGAVDYLAGYRGSGSKSMSRNYVVLKPFHPGAAGFLAGYRGSGSKSKSRNGNKMASASVMLVQPKGELWEKIRVELNENVNTRDQDLATIKDWLKKQPHLPDEWGEIDDEVIFEDDRCLMSFLRGCNFSLERCKKKLDMYFTMRSACPEFFSNRDITNPELHDLMKRAQGPTMPGLTPSGRRVTICKALDKKLDPAQLNDAFKIAMMIGDVRLMEEIEGVAGDIYILDASVVSPSHLGKLSPSALKKFFICVQEAYPIKLKEVHVVNSTPLVETVYNVIKPFLKEKMRQRIHFHSSYTALHEFVPKELLPTEYGGTGCPLDEINSAWIKKLEEYKDWFKAQENLKANEALRPGKPTNYDELFGIDGSFRQLAID
uniref:SFRICE_008001 n=1 Tax=Spodoptera frugiperda TaxID=7108 RepID=A0A2H1WHQ3_SPOFR